MKIAFTFRNLEPSEWIKSYATDKVAKLQKYVHAPLAATLTFSLERHMHCIDLSLQAGGETFLAREEQEDMYASIDLVVDKARQQLRRTKDAHVGWRRAVPMGSGGE
jgi:putative sigma-54 modulation protein